MTFALRNFLFCHSEVREIVQKFGTPGHSAIQEVDNVHSHIEKHFKCVQIYSPLSVVKELKKVRPANMKIIQLSSKDLRDFQTSSTCFKYSSVPFTKVKCIKLTSELPMHVQYRLSFTEPLFDIVYLVRQTRSGNTIGIDRTPFIHYLKTKPNISDDKLKDIESMLKFLPDTDRAYLENLCKIGTCRRKRLFPESTATSSDNKKMKACSNK
jgi:hypothetical protein